MPPKDDPAASLTQSLLRRAHSPDSASRIWSEKIQHRPLFLRPSSPPPSTISAREARRKARLQQKNARQRTKQLKPKPLSARERRRLGLYVIPKQGRKYSVFEPLNTLWAGYAREILGNEIYGNTGTAGVGTAAAKLSAADFHGAEVEVVRSRCPSRVGVRGIVVKDSKFVFEVVTKRDQVKILPKEGTMFRVRVAPPPPSPPPSSSSPTDTNLNKAGSATGGAKGEGAGGKAKAKRGRGEEEENEEEENAFVFEIHGDQFQYRSSDRANKKFKNHFLKML